MYYSQEDIEKPHCPLEVESRSREHHVDVVAEDPGIEVAAETVVYLEVSDDGFNSGSFCRTACASSVTCGRSRPPSARPVSLSL